MNISMQTQAYFSKCNKYHFLSTFSLFLFCLFGSVLSIGGRAEAAVSIEESSSLNHLEDPQIKAANVGLLIVATGRYIEFVDSLIESANTFFCKDHHVTYFVFTDQNYIPPKNTICVPQKRMGWPYDSMMRYHIYYANKELFNGLDYMFAIDADMRFVNDVGSEILSDHTAVIHPGFPYRRGTYETNMQSKAGIGSHEGRYYYCGGVYGGSRERFLHICKTNMDNIDDDLSRGIIAIWHDESHWNRYCIDHEPSLILSPSYCYPDSRQMTYTPRILALTKNHEAYRK